MPPIVIAVYVLRNLQEEFQITQEYILIVITFYVTCFLYTFFMVLTPHIIFVRDGYVDYIMLVRSIICLYVSGVIPIRLSYKANSIIPFPLNEECIKTLEMALLMPTSANYFYNYLENFAEDRDALIYFGLYADIRQFLRMIEDGENIVPLRKQADSIYRDYICDQREWKMYIPPEVRADLKEKFQIPGKVKLFEQAAGDSIFTDLFIFVLEMLDNYYKEFQKSQLYEALKDEVSKQEILYEILRRYDLINNY